MLTYFKPLRRKIGVVTLFLTIVCVDGWINSYLGLHEFQYWTRDKTKWQIVSMRGDIHMEIFTQNGSHSVFRQKLPYATVTVPLIVATAFLLLPKARERRAPLPVAEDPQS